MKRFAFDNVCGEADDRGCGVTENADGIWVLFEEAQEIIERKDAELAAANEQIAALVAVAIRHGLTPQSSKSPLGYLSGLITEQAKQIEQLLANNRKLALIVSDQTLKLAELERLEAAIATPEVYAGIVSDITEKAFAAHVKQLRTENDALKAQIVNLKKV